MDHYSGANESMTLENLVKIQYTKLQNF